MELSAIDVSEQDSDKKWRLVRTEALQQPTLPRMFKDSFKDTKQFLAIREL